MIEILTISFLFIIIIALVVALLMTIKSSNEQTTILTKALKAKDFVDMTLIDKKPQPVENTEPPVSDFVNPNELSEEEWDGMIKKQLEPNEE